MYGIAGPTKDVLFKVVLEGQSLNLFFEALEIRRSSIADTGAVLENFIMDNWGWDDY